MSKQRSRFLSVGVLWMVVLLCGALPVRCWWVMYTMTATPGW